MNGPYDFEDEGMDWEEASENCGAASEDDRAGSGVGCLRVGEEYCSFFCPFHLDVFRSGDEEA